MQTKKCIICGDKYSTSNLDNKSYSCRPCYTSIRKERKKKFLNLWKHSNNGKNYMIKYKNTEANKKYMAEYNFKRANNPIYNKYKYFSSKLRKFLIKEYPGSWGTKQIAWLGCSANEFKLHIELLASKKGWDLSDYPVKFELDHIIGVLANAKTINNVVKLNHYTNIRPLEVSLNRSRYWKEKNEKKK